MGAVASHRRQFNPWLGHNLDPQISTSICELVDASLFSKIPPGIGLENLGLITLLVRWTLIRDTNMFLFEGAAFHGLASSGRLASVVQVSCVLYDKKLLER